jgi:hypothetical protein
MAQAPQSRHGFARAGRLLQGQIRRAGESRGFSVSRLVTHWDEIMGDDIAAISIPVHVRYGRQGLGATLTLLTTGANAPLLEMQKEQIRTKANACYGYNAISKITITQTAPTGFSEGQVAFDHKKKAEPPKPDPALAQAAHKMARDVTDDGLKQALERLGQNVLSKSKR